ncbi:MAG: DUF2924 domain-containing protein [Alphaproteobacteria bacterium]
MGTRTDNLKHHSELKRTVERLHGLRLNELRKTWIHELGDQPPPVSSPDFIRRLLAWKLQERAFGGLAKQTDKRLRDLGRKYAANSDHPPSSSVSIKPGTVLGRRWNGVRHDVTVTRDGFLYDGERFASLSKVARHITGTRWNGPLFFGLRKRGTTSPEARHGQ